MSTAKSRLVRPADEEIQFIWADLRAKPLRRRRQTPNPPWVYKSSVEPVLRWTLSFNDQEPRPTMMVIPGASEFDRTAFYRQYLSSDWAKLRPDCVEDVDTDASRDWYLESVVENVTRRLAKIHVPWEPAKGHSLFHAEWELILALLIVEPFTVEGALKDMVDQPHYLVHQLYKALWELRFTAKESTEQVRDLYPSLVRWMTAADLTDIDHKHLERLGIQRRVQTDAERYDLLFCLLTLATQNGILNRYVIGFDGLERVLQPEMRSTLRELDAFIGAADRWVRFANSPIGVVVGFRAFPRDITQLRHLNAKLAARIEAGLAWAKPPRR